MTNHINPTRAKLSPRLLRLPSAYRTTAWAEVYAPPVEGQGTSMMVARFASSTPGHVDVFAKQKNWTEVTEISEQEFMHLITQTHRGMYSNSTRAAQ